MFGWLSSTAVFASPMKRFTKASSTASSGRICFTTRRFSKPTAPRNVARNTRAMPPAAISRSSTYLPKICGNIATVYVSAAAGFWLLSGCSAPEPREIVLPLTVHSLPSCPIPTPAQVDLAALGDFPTRNDTMKSLSLTAQGVRLGFPQSTLALAATAQPDASDQAFLGFSERSQTGLDFLLWPELSACELYRAGGYPAGLGGEAIGFASCS